MKGILITVFLLITAVSSQINFVKLFTGNETPLPWPLNTVIKIGNVTRNNQNMTRLDVEASKNAIELFDLLRRMFGVGLFSLPPLDPYRINSRNRIILSPLEFVNGTIDVSSVTITGAKQFSVEDFKLRLKTGSIDYKILIKELRIIIDNVDTDLLVNGMPLNLQLKLSIILDNLVLSGVFQANKKMVGELEKKSIFQLDEAILTMNTSEVRVAITNNPAIDIFTYLRYLNQISSLPSEWWLNIKADVEHFILEAMMKRLNDILSNFSVEQVEAFLLPSEQGARNFLR